MITFSCDQKTAESDTRTEEISSPESQEQMVAKAFSTQLSNWENHWKSKMESFNIEHFIKSEEHELPDMSTEIFPEAKPGPEFQKNMIYSPDKARYLDLYSYKIIIQQKDGQLKGSINPDTEAIVIDIDKGTQNRLLFMGPAGGIEDAAWLNNDEIILTGFGETETGEFFPLFWHVNLSEMTIQSYEYPISTEYETKSYLQKKFSGVKF